MPKAVGLSRSIKLPWLNQALELEQTDLEYEEKKAALQEYLSYEIESAIILRKSREILLNVWTYQNEFTPFLKREAIQIAERYPDDRLVLHWCMLMAAYPFFDDVAEIIGKLSEFQGEVTLSQLKKKLYDEWGERATLAHSVDKLMTTMVNLGVIRRVRSGVYQVVGIPVTNTETVNFMIYAVMVIQGKECCAMQELRDFRQLFPFEYTLSREQVLMDQGHFEASTLGGELMILVRKQSGKCSSDESVGQYH